MLSVSRLSAGFWSGPLFPSSLTSAALFTTEIAGKGLFALTAKSTKTPAPPAAIEPAGNVHTVPAGSPSEHDQPPELAPALKVVLAGTVSLTTTPVAFWLPVFVSVKV